MENKPKVAVLGGCGFIGREIVRQLVENKSASHIVVVDKVPPQMAFLGSKHQESFKNPCVKFKSANLINPSSVKSAFDEPYDWVINAAGETKPGLSESIYKEGITRLSLNCAEAAAKNGVKLFVEISDGRISSSGKSGVSETDDVKASCVVSSCKLKVEKKIKLIKGLNWIIVRPALVYGPGDKYGAGVRNLVMGAVYRHLQEKMKLLWDANLRVNTVHVIDLARSVLFLCEKGPTKEVYHVVDHGDSTQGSLINLISSIFDIKVDFYGTVASHLAKVEGNVAEVNEKHLPPWAEMCCAGSVSNTPLSPYVDSDIFNGSHLHLQGNKLRNLGFTYIVPQPTQELLIKMLEELVELNIFPLTAIPSGIIKN